MLCCTPELVFDVELEIFVVVVIELFLPEREKHRSAGWLAGARLQNNATPKIK